MNYNHKKGLTLVELLIVITIIGLLASVFAINVGKFRSRTRDSQRVADIRSIAQTLAFYFYRSEHLGSYPIGDVYITGSDSISTSLINSGAISIIPVDPLNEEDYRYYYCSLENNCSVLGGSGTDESDGDSYILMYYLETSAIAGKNQGQNFETP